MGHVLDGRGKPVYNDNAANPGPQFDFQAGADFTEKVGGLLKGTSTERSLITPSSIGAGWLFSETDTGSLYKWSSTGWDLVWSDTGWVSLPRASGMTALDGVSSAYRIMGAVVWIRIAATGVFPAGLRNVANGLPVEARPSPSTGIVRAAAAGGPGGAPVVATVFPQGHAEAGNVAVANLTGSDRTWAAGVFSYPKS